MKVSKVKVHENQAMGDKGDARHEDFVGNDGADTAADLGRLRRQDGVVWPNSVSIILEFSSFLATLHPPLTNKHQPPTTNHNHHHNNHSHNYHNHNPSRFPHALLLPEVPFTKTGLGGRQGFWQIQWRMPRPELITPSGAARRRRARRLRQFPRHERPTVAMALAELQHHTAPRGQRMARTG